MSVAYCFFMYMLLYCFSGLSAAEAPKNLNDLTLEIKEKIFGYLPYEMQCSFALTTKENHRFTEENSEYLLQCFFYRLLTGYLTQENKKVRYINKCIFKEEKSEFFLAKLLPLYLPLTMQKKREYYPALLNILKK